MFLLLAYVLERFSLACRETKTTVITMANHNRRRQSNEPIRTRSKYMLPASSAGNACRQVTIGFGFTSDWLTKWREIF